MQEGKYGGRCGGIVPSPVLTFLLMKYCSLTATGDRKDHYNLGQLIGPSGALLSSTHASWYIFKKLVSRRLYLWPSNYPSMDYVVKLYPHSVIESGAFSPHQSSIFSSLCLDK